MNEVMLYSFSGKDSSCSFITPRLDTISMSTLLMSEILNSRVEGQDVVKEDMTTAGATE